VRWRELSPRPRWRLLLGAGLLGGGAVTVGFGAGALAVDGSCVDVPMGVAQQCETRYMTMPLGLGLVGAGAGVALLGALFLAVPGTRRDYSATVTLAPCPQSGTPPPAATTTPPRLCATANPGGR
jgi:hypothetical protein